jgi:hypothetical protein
MLESAVTEATGGSSGGVAVEPLPNAAAAAAAGSGIFKIISGNGSSMIWMRVQCGRVLDGDTCLKQ